VRLFVAVELGDTLVKHVTELIGELRNRSADMAPRAKVTWPGHERLHLTIAFIGEVEDARAAAIQAALARAIHVPAFDLTLAGTGAFPNHGPPRVLWAGIEQGKESLIALEHEISERLAVLGIPREKRPYNPHLTLARVREPGGLRAGRLYEGLEDRRLGTTHVDAITLFQSRLSPRGPTYVPLLRASLPQST
jgi:2'-5' RNA ligase